MSPLKQREIGFFNQNTEQNRDGDIREHKNNDLEGNNLWFLRWIKVSKRAFFAVSLLCFLTKSACYNHSQYLQFSFRDYNSSADCLLVCYFLFFYLLLVLLSPCCWFQLFDHEFSIASFFLFFYKILSIFNMQD